jgi:hypothetical protein
MFPQYVVKPVDPKHLVQLIAALLPGRPRAR